MCIVIDTNTIAAVFNPADGRHKEFGLVEEWIRRGHGFMVYGGKKYKGELSSMKKYNGVILELRNKRLVVPIDDKMVDDCEANVINQTKGSSCDDQHIIAILWVSHCPLLCSSDKRSFEFIRDKQLCPNHVRNVKIYTSSRNKNLLKKTKKEVLRNAI